MRISLSVLFAILGLVCVLLLSATAPEPAGPDTLALRARLAEDGHVIHAGGFCTTAGGEQVMYTNSLESLENLYARGNRFCEADILKTADGTLVCGHPGEGSLVYGTELPSDATGEEYLSTLLYGELHPLSLDMLAEFMESHEDLYVIADLKSDHLELCQEIAERYPALLDRIIMQIYLPEEYEPVRELGFRHLVYSVLSAPLEDRRLVNLADFTRSHELLGLIFPTGYFTSDFKQALAQSVTGVPVILITLNGYREMAYYLNHGLCMAVYTDQTVFPRDVQEGNL